MLPSPFPQEVSTVLVLKRKVEESITIADEIKIKILSILGESVNVGVEAPRQFKINRTDNLNENNGNGNGNIKSLSNGNGKRTTHKTVNHSKNT